MKIKILPAIAFVAAPYLFIWLGHFIFRYYFNDVTFSSNKVSLGTAISSYAGTTIAILIAALTFVIGIRNNNMVKIRKYGYMASIVVMYSFTFVELGALFLTGILLISNINGIPLATISLFIAIASFIHICLLLMQLFLLASKK
ncbi:biopolymer transporter ExbB [Xenorhabdus taiwanensis]|uniref:Biopolymer transporter ExbB n=1 Tax=Xenorhabdus taiwanensis TaxID=3085177 RepID=A0ABN7C6U1_9GAMM|nr:hypothetical protein TCT1_30030 [Xenorhabdus sp. TCT-1]